MLKGESKVIATKQDDYARNYLHNLSTDVTCLWCKHPVKPVHRLGLCWHCYDIRRRTNRLRKDVGTYKQGGDGDVPHVLDFELRVAERMEEAAKNEGQTYGELHDADINGRQLADEFSYISRELVCSELYRFMDTVFDRGFTRDQRRLLFYLLSLTSRAHLRRTRRFDIMNSDLHRTK
jgi:hypothetical protein